MTDPIDKMVEAHRKESALWEYRDYRSGDFEIIRDGKVVVTGNWRLVPGGVGELEMKRLRDAAAMRAAVLALAEAEPTNEMKRAAFEAPDDWDALSNASKAYIRAAAKE